MIRGFVLLLIVGAALAQGAVPARAQEPGPNAVSEADRTAITACLRESSESPRACIGTIAVVCVRQAGGDRREAEIACSRREARVWRERLDMAGRVLMQRLDSAAGSRLAAVQRSWEAYTAQKCAYHGEIQPAAQAAATQAACELREAAVRSLEMGRLASRPGGANRPARPEIFR